MALESGKNFAAIIAAGGSGSRFNVDSSSKKPPADCTESSSPKPKQFLTLRGRPLYYYCLRALASHASIRQIVIVAPAIYIDELSRESSSYKSAFGIKQSINVIEGGASRQESVFNGMKFLSAEPETPDYVLIHDAARPFLNKESVSRVIEAAIEYDACTVGGAVSDTIKRVHSGKVLETIPREELLAVQTPQAARFEHLLKAHHDAAKSGHVTTDDAALLEWAGHDVFVIPGPAYNLKITQPLDLIVCEALGDYLLQDPM